METVLLVITIISVATAAVALLSARKVQRHDRERSEARVAALSAAADTHSGADRGTQASGDWHWTPEPAVTRDLDNFFGTVQRADPATGRVPMLAAAVLIVMIGGALMLLNSSTSSRPAATTAQIAHNEPLELVSLGHARDPNLLTISGTVRNPATGLKLEGLAAVVSLLDRTGALVSTKDVPLDYRALRPGEEAPFKVSIPDPGAIARYRVSFRAGSDVVPHVDRRTDTKLASAIH
ncbi:MAG TPA: hypothetical protein VJM31_18240 [Vicinamibacterales bacterium]|nr:hypothetical protein [Vicinamibacterales bacterium]